MTSETDPNLNQTSFTLDNFHRLSGTDLPGNADTSDSSEQDYGYGSTNSSNPASLTLASSVSPTATDANDNSSGYQTDQFGNITSEGRQCRQWGQVQLFRELTNVDDRRHLRGMAIPAR